MEKPKLEDYKREVNDGADQADWYEEYFKALEKYCEHLESKLKNHSDLSGVSDTVILKSSGLKSNIKIDNLKHFID